MKLPEFLERLQSVRKMSRGYLASCPAHDDKKPSLSISVGKDGRLLIRCFAGCQIESILFALDLEMKDLFEDRLSVRGTDAHAIAKPNGARKIVAMYDYTDEAGNLLFQSVRFEPKDFRQRQPDGKGGWLWNLRNVRLVLYRLPEVVASPVVYVVEGEKDVDTLRRNDLPATCNPMGAGKWRESYNEFLRGKTIVLLPDNDGPGRNHAQQVATSLHGVAKEVVIVNLPGLRPKGDVTDYFENGGTAEELIQMAGDAIPFDLAGPTAVELNSLNGTTKNVIDNGHRRGLQIEFLDTVEALEISWLAKPLIPFGFFTLLDGIEGIGKTYAMLDLAKRLTLGEPMPFTGGTHDPSKVLFLSVEDSPEYVLKPRFEKMGGDCSRLAVLRGHFDFSDAGFADLEETVNTHQIRFVLIDPLFSFTGRADINNTSDVRPITDRLNRIAAEHKIAIVGVRHINKSKGYGDARNAGAHSVAWLQGCRSGLIVGHDVEDKSKRGIVQHKLNIGVESKATYGFVIDDQANFCWTGESDLSIQSMLAHKSKESNEDRNAIDHAIRFLTDQLAAGGRRAIDLENEARAAGISKRTLDRAKQTLRVLSHKVSRNWFWELP